MSRVGRVLVLVAALVLGIGRVASAQAELQLRMTTVVPETTEVFQGVA